MVLISRIKQGKDMNLEVEDPTREVDLEVEAEIQFIDVTLVTSSVINHTSALIMIMQDKGVIMLPKERKKKYKHLR